MNDVMVDIKNGKLALEENQREATLRPAAPAPQGAQRRGANMDENFMLDDQEAAVRARQVRRLELQNDVPESVRKALSSSSGSAATSIALVRGLQPAEREELLDEDDEMPPPLDVSSEDSDVPMPTNEAPEPSQLDFQRKKQLFEEISQNPEGMPSVLTEAQLRSQMATTSTRLKNIKKIIRKSRQGRVHQEARRRRGDQQVSASIVMYAESVDMACEKAWLEADREMDLQEAFWTHPDREKQAVQEIQDQIESRDIQHGADVVRSQILTGKERVEFQWQRLDERWREAFKEPILKAIQIYFDYDALEGVPKDKFVDPKRILSSRFVLTNKGGDTLDKAELKGRLILGGHKDPDMGRYTTMAPTAALLAHNLINWISVQMGWVVHYEDVSSAFLQGKHLPPEREVYVRLPKGYPEYVEAFIREKLGELFRQGLLKLTKGGFGLPESPRLWYLEYSDVLSESGMRELKLLPGVFAAYHDDGSLRAVACIHVDDTRYAGDETAQAIWDKVHQRLRFGKLRKATDGWTKFCGRWERQNPSDPGVWVHHGGVRQGPAEDGHQSQHWECDQQGWASGDVLTDWSAQLDESTGALWPVVWHFPRPADGFQAGARSFGVAQQGDLPRQAAPSPGGAQTGRLEELCGDFGQRCVLWGSARWTKPRRRGGGLGGSDHLGRWRQALRGGGRKYKDPTDRSLQYECWGEHGSDGIRTWRFCSSCPGWTSSSRLQSEEVEAVG